MPGPVLLLALLAAVGDGLTSAALGELVFLPLASLVTLVTLVPICQVLWHACNLNAKLDRGSIRSSPRDGLSTPYRLTEEYCGTEMLAF